MGRKNLRGKAKETWLFGGSAATQEELRTGALLRIADAAEKMALNVTRLQEELDRYKGYHKCALRGIDRGGRRISALRGVITKLKRRLADAEGGGE